MRGGPLSIIFEDAVVPLSVERCSQTPWQSVSRTRHCAEKSRIIASMGIKFLLISSSKMCSA
jgi:hypothetical protein